METINRLITYFKYIAFHAVNCVMTLFFLHMAINRLISDSLYKFVQEGKLVDLRSECQRQSEQWQGIETNFRLVTCMEIV
jgi:hypothetical protein